MFRALALAATALAQKELAQELADLGLDSVLRFEAGLGRAAASEAANANLPVVMMHGMGDYATNPMGMISIKNNIEKVASTYVHSVELCSDKSKLANCAHEDQSNGFFMTMDDQVDQFARVVQADEKLKAGFNAIGFSQGNTVIRGYIHKYNNPPVKTFVSMHGVLMGVNGLPQCPMEVPGVGILCRAVDAIISHAGVYTSFVQNHLAQANYYRDAANLKEYRADGHFLPYINNEVEGQENATYKKNFQSLEKLVLVMAEDDTMVHPKESEHFGYFKDGTRTEIVAMKDAPWYTEDWFGLKSLDQQKKIDFFSTPGNHLRFTGDFLLKMVKTYFAQQEAVMV
ncbi:unnamed protein product [Effrenium voratum]|nr:unnamed protein product [Effrenium voratum]